MLLIIHLKLNVELLVKNCLELIAIFWSVETVLEDTQHFVRPELSHLLLSTVVEFVGHVETLEHL
jgi:hypothetical protein